MLIYYIIATVILTIQSLDEDRIEFSRPWTLNNPEIRVTMLDGQGYGSPVITLVAVDSVTGDNVNNFRKVEFSDPNNLFSVHAATGQLLYRWYNDRLPCKYTSIGPTSLI